MRMIALLAAGLLAGCATTSTTATQPSAPQSVEFAVTPCFGSCPVFSITLFSDGKGRYEGQRFVAQKGVHEFQATPEQVQAFFDRLRPFRPQGAVRYDIGHCPVPASTDSPSVDVLWRSAASEDSLHWYRGCRVPALTKIAPDLYEAWKELPLADLVGTAEDRFQYDKRGG